MLLSCLIVHITFKTIQCTSLPEAISIWNQESFSVGEAIVTSAVEKAKYQANKETRSLLYRKNASKVRLPRARNCNAVTQRCSAFRSLTFGTSIDAFTPHLTVTGPRDLSESSFKVTQRTVHGLIVRYKIVKIKVNISIRM